MTRRHLAGLLLGLPGCLRTPRAAGSSPSRFEVDKLMPGRGATESLDMEKLYRADAVITLLSVPIYSRAGVGSGFAALSEVPEGSSRTTSLRFGAGSLPEHTRGLNKLGFIHEVVKEESSRLARTAYFGFLTWSPEESLGQSKDALENGGEGVVSYLAVDGYTCPEEAFCTEIPFNFPARYTWAHSKSLFDQVRSVFHSTHGPSRKTSRQKLQSGSSTPCTFLYAVLKAIQSSARHTEMPFVYNGKQYKLSTDKRADRRQGARFAALKLTNNPESVVRLRGVIKNYSNGQNTEFKLWLEDAPGQLLPLRIEYHPRSFLKLSFQVDPSFSVSPGSLAPDS
ncbi:MAG: hypothetical protein ACRD7E_24325 [Bryobacteraceae bacterium]